MKKMLLWEKIHSALSGIEDKLNSQNYSDESRELEVRKQFALAELFSVIDLIGNLTENSKVKYELWLNRGYKGKKRKEISDSLGMSTDAIRASVLYFDNRLEFFVGENIVGDIMSCNSNEELKKIVDQFRYRVGSIKAYFR
ncbi:hypothetical protein [Bacillus sp. FJAT-45350]|uniref:hypothetical protein n=1 Tax=Bacillus sp. FJAT-45350 TaxID=2011014 RepID=UPI000BB8F389|nr:hypothetical protein [Bacillus sp. FJAT-45350]